MKQQHLVPALAHLTQPAQDLLRIVHEIREQDHESPAANRLAGFAERAADAGALDRLGLLELRDEVV